MVYKSKLKTEPGRDIATLMINFNVVILSLVAFAIVLLTVYAFYERSLFITLRTEIVAENTRDYSKYELHEPQYIGLEDTSDFDKAVIDEDVEASSVFAFNPITEEIFYERNSHEQVSIASITKLMTVYVAQQYSNPSDTLVAGEYDLEYLEWVLGLEDGDSMTYGDALKAMLISSYNDAAYLVADNYPAGYESFIDEMNYTAERLGMDDTHFTNPAGLDDEEHYSSVWDLKRLIKKVLEDEYLLEIVGVYRDTIDIEKVSSGETESVGLQSTNQLLGTTQYMKGLKTGFTTDSGQSFVSYYQISEDNELVTIIIDAAGDRFEETSELVELLRVY